MCDAFGHFLHLKKGIHDKKLVIHHINIFKSHQFPQNISTIQTTKNGSNFRLEIILVPKVLLTSLPYLFAQKLCILLLNLNWLDYPLEYLKINRNVVIEVIITLER